MVAGGVSQYLCEETCAWQKLDRLIADAMVEADLLEPVSTTKLLYGPAMHVDLTAPVIDSMLPPCLAYEIGVEASRSVRAEPWRGARHAGMDGVTGTALCDNDRCSHPSHTLARS